MSTMFLKPNLGCSINLPPALSGEALHALPPFAETEAYPVEAFPACPPNWEKGGPSDKAFFVEVQKGQGLWLNFNGCRQHTHEVAALISIQGINPITGKPVATPAMEQYQEGDTPQNYLSTTGTPHGHFWLDGFRGADGEVRQYVFTEETLRGIASQVIGDARSFSIGVAFFLSKTAKPIVAQRTRGFSEPFNWGEKLGGNHGPADFPGDRKGTWEPTYGGPSKTWDAKPDMTYGSGKGHLLRSMTLSTEPELPRSGYSHVVEESFRGIPGLPGIPDMDSNQIQETEHTDAFAASLEKEAALEIAAGARIRQQIWRDPQRLDFWEPNPEGLLYIHYVGKTEGTRIRKVGRVGAKQEGGLEGLTVGN